MLADDRDRTRTLQTLAQRLDALRVSRARCRRGTPARVRLRQHVGLLGAYAAKAKTRQPAMIAAAWSLPRTLLAHAHRDKVSIRFRTGDEQERMWKPG